MMKKTLVLFVLLAQCAALPAQAVTFEVGQLWSYRTRPGEEDSRLYIARIDRDMGSKPIVHVYVDRLKLKNPLLEAKVQDHLVHVPISREALEASVISLIQKDVTPPDISEGYIIWREAFLEGRAGVFTISLQQVVQYIEDQFAKQAGAQQ
ncbi:hypothetical protein [Pelagibius marinus]|uniref:hypothetical protein n=1 Tax=Pelagibius marinus TaxID=2762760 RepID=UPI001872E395|nr:hypothetical protein [Pelagibius marinus]